MRCVRVLGASDGQRTFEDGEGRGVERECRSHGEQNEDGLIRKAHGRRKFRLEQSFRRENEHEGADDGEDRGGLADRRDRGYLVVCAQCWYRVRRHVAICPRACA